VINSSGFHGMQEEIEAASSFEEISPRDLGTVQNALAASLAAPWPEALMEAVTAFEVDAQALADALTAADLEATQEAVAGIHHTQHELSGAAFEWLATNDGDALMAGLINSRYLGRVENALAIVLATPWYDDLKDPAGRFAGDLKTLAEALAANNLTAAAEAGHAIHSSQHDLSHDTYEWLGDQEEVTADPAAVLAAIDVIDSTGFHGMTEEIANASSFEEISPRNLGRVQNAWYAGLVVIWPGEVASQAQTFLADAKALVEALNTADLEASIAAAEAIHGSQHDLSHEIYHWLGGQGASAIGVGAIVSAIDIIDSSGFHGMSEEIEAAAGMKDISPRNLGTVESALAAAGLVNWPAGLLDFADDFIASASSLALALESGDLESAKEAAGDVHHSQHDLSNAVYAWLFEEVGGNPVAMHVEDGGHGDGHAEQDLPEEYADAEVIALEVTDWGWDPAVITLNVGEPVVLEITNTGLMPHGIWVPSLAINMATPPGSVTLVPLTPEETGEFMMGCNEPLCGTAEQHAEMFTTIVVE
jgi:heme/copper-type cytochrome/quinol oxidase subunit 2